MPTFLCFRRTGQIGLTHRRSCAFDGRTVACLSYSPFRWLSTHLSTPLSGVALTSTCILFAALRACWSGRSQVDVRARRALSGARRQAEFDAFGAGDAMVATSRAPTPTWLGLALLLLDAASAPPLSACAALQYRRCFPAASATRRLDQVPVEPGTSATSFTTVLLGRTPASSSLAPGRPPPQSFRHGRASTATRPLLFFVHGQNDFQAGPVLRTQGDRCSCGHALAAKVAVVSASSSTCWLEFFGRRSFFSAPPATAVHRLLNLRVDVGLEPVEPAPQVLLPLVRLHIGLLASCQFHPAEAISHWLTLPRGGLGF